MTLQPGTLVLMCVRSFAVIRYRSCLTDKCVIRFRACVLRFAGQFGPTRLPRKLSVESERFPDRFPTRSAGNRFPRSVPAVPERFPPWFPRFPQERSVTGSRTPMRGAEPGTAHGPEPGTGMRLTRRGVLPPPTSPPSATSALTRSSTVALRKPFPATWSASYTAVAL